MYEIPNQPLKNINPELLHLLLEAFNEVWQSGVVPGSSNTSVVFPPAAKWNVAERLVVFSTLLLEVVRLQSDGTHRLALLHLASRVGDYIGL